MLYLFYFRVTVRRFHSSDPAVYIETALAPTDREAVAQVRERRDYRDAVSVTIERV
jgi:hypothetical protein